MYLSHFFQKFNFYALQNFLVEMFFENLIEPPVSGVACLDFRYKKFSTGKQQSNKHSLFFSNLIQFKKSYDWKHDLKLQPVQILANNSLFFPILLNILLKRKKIDLPMAFRYLSIFFISEGDSVPLTVLAWPYKGKPGKVRILRDSPDPNTWIRAQVTYR